MCIRDSSVRLRDMVARMRKSLREISVVGEDKKSFAVPVETSDGIYPALYSVNKFRDDASVVLRFHGRYNASRLVKCKILFIARFQAKSLFSVGYPVVFGVDVLSLIHIC